MIWNLIKGNSDMTDAEFAKKKMKHAKLSLLIGLAVLVLGAGGVYYQSTQDNSKTQLVLGKDAEPKSTQVTIIGKLQDKYGIEYTKSSRKGRKTVEIIYPVTAPDWKEGDPVKYFISIGKNAKIKGDQNSIKFDGYVVENGLDSMVKDAYVKDKLNLTEPYYVIDESAPFLMSIWKDPYMWAGIIWSLTLLAAVVNFAQAKWAARRAAQNQ